MMLSCVLHHGMLRWVHRILGGSGVTSGIWSGRWNGHTPCTNPLERKMTIRSFTPYAPAVNLSLSNFIGALSIVLRLIHKRTLRNSEILRMLAVLSGASWACFPWRMVCKSVHSSEPSVSALCVVSRSDVSCSLLRFGISGGHIWGSSNSAP